MRTHGDHACWSIITSVIMSVGFPGDSAIKNPCAMQETQVQSLGQKDPLEKGVAPTPVFLENCVDRGAWLATVPGVAKELDTT